MTPIGPKAAWFSLIFLSCDIDLRNAPDPRRSKIETRAQWMTSVYSPFLLVGLRESITKANNHAGSSLSVFGAASRNFFTRAV